MYTHKTWWCNILLVLTSFLFSRSMFCFINESPLAELMFPRSETGMLVSSLGLEGIDPTTLAVSIVLRLESRAAFGSR